MNDQNQSRLVPEDQRIDPKTISGKQLLDILYGHIGEAFRAWVAPGGKLQSFGKMKFKASELLVRSSLLRGDPVLDRLVRGVMAREHLMCILLWEVLRPYPALREVLSSAIGRISGLCEVPRGGVPDEEGRGSMYQRFLDEVNAQEKNFKPEVWRATLELHEKRFSEKVRELAEERERVAAYENLKMKLMPALEVVDAAWFKSWRPDRREDWISGPVFWDPEVCGYNLVSEDWTKHEFSMQVQNFAGDYMEVRPGPGGFDIYDRRGSIKDSGVSPEELRHRFVAMFAKVIPLTASDWLMEKEKRVCEESLPEAPQGE